MLFIDGIDQHPAGCTIRHIDIVRVWTTVSCGVHLVQNAIFLWCICERAVFCNKSCQIFCPSIRKMYGYPKQSIICKCRLRLAFILAAKHHGNLFFYIPRLLLIRMFHLVCIQRQDLPCFQNILLAADTTSGQRKRLVLHGSVGKASWEMAVIQNPHLHVTFSRLVQDHIHILPPFVTAEIRMWTTLHTDRSNICFINRSHVITERILVLSMLPKEWQNVIFMLIV